MAGNLTTVRPRQVRVRRVGTGLKPRPKQVSQTSGYGAQTAAQTGQSQTSRYGAQTAAQTSYGQQQGYGQQSGKMAGNLTTVRPRQVRVRLAGTGLKPPPRHRTDSSRDMANSQVRWREISLQYGPDRSESDQRVRGSNRRPDIVRTAAGIWPTVR